MQKIIVAKIFGGLGNQMFQYAFGVSLAKMHNADLLVDIRSCSSSPRGFMLSNFNITEKIANEDEIKKFEGVVKLGRNTFANFLSSPFKYMKYLTQRNCRIPERSHSYNEYNLHFNGNAYIYGAWQSPKYFCNIRNELHKIYTLKSKIDDKNLNILEKIAKTNSVSIHIRRGDYVSEKYKNDFVQLDINYYEKAIGYIKNKYPDAVFFIFSNDINWCKNNFGHSNTFKYVDQNSELAGHIDMYLMSQCKHNIIANSTFSWWGAWLNQNESKIVICPSKWFGPNLKNHSIRDLYEESWIKL
ncbi:MAG: alpha-1,2-fucosyltransferase [Campylobacterales bacterium]